MTLIPSQPGENTHVDYPYSDHDLETHELARFEDPNYDPTGLEVGDQVTRLVPHSTHIGDVPVQVVEIGDSQIVCRYDMRQMTFNKQTGVCEDGVKFGRLETS